MHAYAADVLGFGDVRVGVVFVLVVLLLLLLVCWCHREKSVRITALYIQYSTSIYFAAPMRERLTDSRGRSAAKTLKKG